MIKNQKDYIEKKARELHHELFGECNEEDYIHGAAFHDIKDFVRQIINDCKPKMSKKAWGKYSLDYDGEMPNDYYMGAGCVFEWLCEIVGVEMEE